MDRPWLSQYPAGVPAEIDVHRFASLKDMLASSCERFADRLALAWKIVRPEVRSVAIAAAPREAEIALATIRSASELLPTLLQKLEPLKD